MINLKQDFEKLVDDRIDAAQNSRVIKENDYERMNLRRENQLSIDVCDKYEGLFRIDSKIYYKQGFNDAMNILKGETF